jgi:hypothetical protein
LQISPAIGPTAALRLSDHGATRSRRSRANQLLNVAGDMYRLHGRDRGHTGMLAPGQEFTQRLRIARRVLRLRMLAVKNSMKRTRAFSPTLASKVGTSCVAKGASWFML